MACKAQWIIDTDVEESSSIQLASIAQNVSHTEEGFSITISGSRPLLLLDHVEFENVSNVNITASERTLVECRKRQPVGISFVNSRNILIRGLNVSRCGYWWNQHKVALFFQNCQDVKLDSVHVGKSWGFALLFWDTGGRVDLELITVYRACQGNPNCSGLGIVFNQCPINNKDGDYVMKNCTIHECNNDVNMILEVSNDDFSLTEFGGGLGIVFKDGNCTNINITNCTISGNSAYWGGGIFIFQRGRAMNNSVQVSHTIFSGNSALVGGGAVMVGLLHTESNVSNLTFYNCSFIHNYAKYGGGTAVFSTHMITSISQAFLYFIKCIWKRNRASFSNDVDLAPARRDQLASGYLPIVKFIDVQFLYNSRLISKGSTVQMTYDSYGSFSTTLFTVHFGGKVLFKHLKNTALHLSSGTARFLPSSQVTFVNNKGINGAALAMYGFSSLQIADNCTLNFTRNEATVFGGAIYFETSDKHDFLKMLHSVQWKLRGLF